MAAAPPRRLRRRWLVVALGALLLAAVAWQVVELVADVDRYRPDVAAELARVSGLPVAIGRLDLAWRPLPCLSAVDVAIGSGDLALTAARVDVFPALHALLSRRVEILWISIDELALTLPPDTNGIDRAWNETWSHLEAAFADPDAAEATTPSSWTVEVSTILADEARVRLGADSDPLLVVDASAGGVTTDTLDLSVEAELPALDARAGGRFFIPLSSDARPEAALRGHLDVRGLRPDRVLDLPAKLSTIITGRIDLSVDASDALRLDLAGDFAPVEEGALEGSFAGDVRFDGAGIATGLRIESGAHVAQAEARWRDGALEIARLEAGPVALRGRVEPGGDGAALLALSGELTLDDTWMHALGVPQTLRDARGVLHIEEVSGHVPPTPGMAPLVVRAELAGGGLRIATDSAEDTLSEIALRVSSREKRIRLDGRARSDQLGNLSLDAVIEPEARTAQGELGFDAGTLTTFITDGVTRDRLSPLLQRYGVTHVAFRLEPVAESGSTYALRLNRVEAPPAGGVLTLHTDGESGLLGDIRATARIGADAFAAVLPEASRATGEASFRLRRSLAERRLEIDADFAELGFASGDFVEKRPGEPLALRLVGTSDWEVNALDISSGEGRISFSIEREGLVARDFALDLADWSHLLVGNARASGSVTGSMDLPASEVSLQLSEVALRLSPEVGVDAIDGAVKLSGEDWSVRDLRVRGAASDATLDASVSRGEITGGLRGANLDLDFVLALYRELEALLPKDDAAAEESASLSGAFTVQLDRIGLGRSEATDVHANVAFLGGDVSVRDLALATYEGRVSGSADVSSRDAGPSRLTLELEVADVTGRFLDDAFFEPPRDIQGRYDASLRFEAPLRDNAKASFAEAGGALTVAGRDGSFGKLGIATKLMTVLRGSEALRAKLPSLRDEGLVFDAMALDLAMHDGIAELSLLDVDSHAYAIDASGTLDFKSEQSRVPIEVNVIKGLVGAVKWIPVAGSALEILNVRMLATGSPWDLQVGVAGFRDQLLGAGRAGVGAVIGDATQALRILRGSGTDEAAPAPEARDLPETPASEEPVPPDPEAPEPPPEATEGDEDALEPTPGESL